MPHRQRLNTFGLAIVLLAVAFLGWTTTLRVRHTQHVSHHVGGVELTVDPQSATGYADGLRALIVPEHDKESYQWIMQTQEMLRREAWRLRHVDYDNAPDGRAVNSASAYRWWLAGAAWIDHLVSGRPLALAVEHVALYVEPALQLLALCITCVFLARWFGVLAVALFALGWATMFPLAGAYVAGQPDDFGLSLFLVLWSVLPLVAPRPTAGSATPADLARLRRRLALAGIVGGFGMWINPFIQGPVVLGVWIGGLIATIQATTKAAGTTPLPLPWRTWSIAGAATSFAAYLLEFAPHQLFTLRLEVIHPAHALSWLAAGELLARFSAARPRRERFSRKELSLAVACLLTVGIGIGGVIWRAAHGYEIVESAMARVSNLPGHVAAENLLTWIAQAGFQLAVFATLTPLIVAAGAAWIYFHSQHDRELRERLALAAGPVVVALGFAVMRLRWWSVVDVLLLSLAAALVPAWMRITNQGRILIVGTALMIGVPGVATLFPPLQPEAEHTISNLEVTALVERDLAHWLARQAGEDGAVVFAPPELTASLSYHGGLRGLGSPYSENRDGFAASIRIAGVTGTDEAETVIRRRGVTHIIMPSWDPQLEEYARLATNQPEASLLGLLRRWLPPRWLRPVAYPMPGISGFEDQHAVIFAVTDVQDNATALSRLGEYFAEMGQVAPARMLASRLEEIFPHDLSALTARAHIAFASADAAAARTAVQAMLPHLDRGGEEELAWDRRVSLTLALIQSNLPDRFLPLLQRCSADANEEGLRSLSTSTLVRLLHAWRHFALEPADPQLRELARKLVPVDMRSHL